MSGACPRKSETGKNRTHGEFIQNTEQTKRKPEMKNRAIRWSVFIPVILVLLAMALALIAISYQTFRDYEI